jgi:hypothetical protein
MAAHCARVVTTPLIAQVMITLSLFAMARRRVAPLAPGVVPPSEHFAGAARTLPAAVAA